MDEHPSSSASAVPSAVSDGGERGSDEVEVERLEALLVARSAEVRDLLAELDRLRVLLRDALGRLAPSSTGAETLALRGEIAGLRARADEGEAALRALTGAATGERGQGTRHDADRDALGQARSALERVADAIRVAARPAPTRDDHDTVPGLSLPELTSSRDDQDG